MPDWTEARDASGNKTHRRLDYAHSVPLRKAYNTFTQLFHYPCGVTSQNRRELLDECAVNLDLPVHRVQRGRLDFDEDLSGAGLGYIGSVHLKRTLFPRQVKHFLLGWGHCGDYRSGGIEEIDGNEDSSLRAENVASLCERM